MEKSEMKILVIGGSAGALSMVLNIATHLRAGMNIAVLIVLHRKQAEENILQEVLISKTDLDVKEAEDKDELLPGVIYLAPIDYHVLIERNDSLALDGSEKVNYSRPSIDVTFESAAEIYGKSLICVLLSGANSDGATGLAKAKEKGATVVIQDPKSADFDYMPARAMEVVKPDLLLDTNNVDRLIDLLVT
jgi:two-component system chemotaxis response regulator CheB